MALFQLMGDPGSVSSIDCENGIHSAADEKSIVMWYKFALNCIWKLHDAVDMETGGNGY